MEMNNPFSLLLYIILFVFSILQIILFFKIWEMTNNVAEIKKFLVNKNFSMSNNSIKKDYPDQDNSNLSRRVKRLSDGKLMLIQYMIGDNYVCIDPETKEQIGKFKKSEIELGW